MGPTSPPAAALDRHVAATLDRYAADLAGLKPPVAYALEGGGKRLRARLVEASYHACGGLSDPGLLGAAVELVHAYSLVHDDLPCMDDDDLRRGRPTAHIVHGVNLATMSGVAMLPLAIHAVLDAAVELGLSEPTTCDIVRTLTTAAGAGGMIGGQLLDLDAEGRELSLGELEAVHSAKTGALIRASVVVGGLAASAGRAQLDALARYGEGIGLAFQIVDDVLDVTGTSEALGKTAGRDAALRKSTYASVLGIEAAERRASEIVDRACADLDRAGLLTPGLEALARLVARRTS